MGFPGECGKRSSNLGEAGADVGRGGAYVAVVGVARVGPRNGVAEVAFDPGERGVAEPVGADLLRGHPWQMSAEANPNVVVSA